MKRSHLLLGSVLSVAFVFVVAASAAAQAPEVLKVEPPSWWVASSLSSVRVLVRGRNLRDARVQAAGNGLSIVGIPKTNASGTYLFVDVTILPNAQLG